MSLNRTILVGRITRDPEVKKTQSGVSVVKFTLAVNRQFNKEETDFIQCVAWRNQADFLGNYIRKGALLGIEGRIETGSYQDKNNQTVYTTTVVADSVQALESKAQRQGAQEHTYEEPAQQEPQIHAEDLPF